MVWWSPHAGRSSGRASFRSSIFGGWQKLEPLILVSHQGLYEHHGIRRVNLGLLSMSIVRLFAGEDDLDNGQSYLHVYVLRM